MKELESDESQLCAARTRAGMDVSLGKLVAVLNLDSDDVSPCRFPRTGAGLLLTARGPNAQKRHKDFVVKEKESPRYFFTATSKVIAHFFVTQKPHL